MTRTAMIGAVAAALLAAGCSGGEKASDNQATANLEAAADNAATELSNLAAQIPDANQANVAVDEAVELSNAVDAAQNTH